VSDLRRRIELAIIGRTAPRAAEAVMALLAETPRPSTGRDDFEALAAWQRERDDPEAGHTFRLTAASRGSYAVSGIPGHTDAEWMPEDVAAPFAIEVRAWNLSDALAKAARLPLGAWHHGGLR
jgi:hypothetical protein